MTRRRGRLKGDCFMAERGASTRQDAEQKQAEAIIQTSDNEENETKAGVEETRSFFKHRTKQLFPTSGGR